MELHRVPAKLQEREPAEVRPVRGCDIADAGGDAGYCGRDHAFPVEEQWGVRRGRIMGVGFVFEEGGRREHGTLRQGGGRLVFSLSIAVAFGSGCMDLAGRGGNTLPFKPPSLYLVRLGHFYSNLLPFIERGNY